MFGEAWASPAASLGLCLLTHPVKRWEERRAEVSSLSDIPRLCKSLF